MRRNLLKSICRPQRRGPVRGVALCLLFAALNLPAVAGNAKSDSEDIPAIIVAVDGLSRDPRHYLYAGLLPFAPISKENLRSVESISDPKDTREAVRRTRRVLREAWATSQAMNSKLIVIAHSWGTLQAYAALTLERDICCDLFISLNSPLGGRYAHPNRKKSNLARYEDVLDMVEKVEPWLEEYDIAAGSTNHPCVREFHNYWAWSDPISGPLKAYMPSVIDHQIDKDEAKRNGPATRNNEVGEPWHTLTGADIRHPLRRIIRDELLDCMGLPREEDNES